MLTKITANGVDLRVVVWVQEFLFGRSQRVRVDEQLSAGVRVPPGVPRAVENEMKTNPSKIKQ